MKKTLSLLIFIAALTANAQVVNKFRDSSWFAKGVKFDSTLVFKGLKTGSTGDTNVVVISSTGRAAKIGRTSFLNGVSGIGTVTNVSVTTANGVSGSVATATSTPAITLTLGAITPTSIVSSGSISGSNLSGTNTGDQDLSSYATSAAVSSTYATKTNLKDTSDLLRTLISAKGVGTVTSVSGTSPISVANGTSTPVISIANSAADGSTKGAASFTANDFNSSSGNISIDYTNGQSASGSTKGFLTSSDWNTFNEKTKTYAGQGLIYRNDSLLITGRLTEPMSILSVGSPVNNPIGGVATVWSDIPTRPTITTACYSDNFSNITGTEVINFNTINTQIVQTGIFDQNSSSDLDDNKLMFLNNNGSKETYLIGLPTDDNADQIVVRDSATNRLYIANSQRLVEKYGVTSVGTGVGLSGGTITGSGTIVADTSGTLVTKAFLTSSLSGISGGGGDSIYYFRTIAQLRTAMSAHTLKKGAKYQATDFQTIYDQPDFESDGTPKASVVTKTASTEHLVFVATSDSTFAEAVNSIEYPTDILNFDWTFTATEVMGAPAKGRISFREDVESANSAFYDFRKVLYLRYESSPGSGVFNSIKDNGGASQEFLTFNAPSVGTKIGIFGALGVQITGIPFYLNNVVFENSAINASVDGVVFNVTFVDITAGVKVGYGSSDILFNGGSAYTYIRVGNNVIFNGQCNFNSLWGQLINITTGDNFNHNIQYDSWTNSTVGNNFTQGILYGLIDSLTAGDDNFKIDIKNGKAITIGDGNSGISFSGTSHILPLNDFNGIKNVSFSGGIDAYGWINGITTSTHPEMYLNLTKTIFIGGNGTDNTQDNVYSRYFNNTTDVITIIN